MAREVSLAMREQLGQRFSLEPWVWLMEARVPSDPPQRYRLCNQKDEFEFGEDSDGQPLVYYPAGFDFRGVEERSDGSLPEIVVTVGNASLELRQNLEDYFGLVDQPAVFRLVNSALAGSSSNQLTWEGEIGEPTITVDGIQFRVSSINLEEQTFPGRRHIALTCGHRRFGAGACPYPIEAPGAAFSSCPRSLEACKKRGDNMVALGFDRLLPLRFGAELGIGRGRF